MNLVEYGPSRSVPGYILGRWDPSAFVSFNSQLNDEQLFALLSKVQFVFSEWEGLIVELNTNQTSSHLKLHNALNIGKLSIEIIKKIGFTVNDDVKVVPDLPGSSWQQVLVPTPINSINLAVIAWKLTIDVINTFAQSNHVSETRLLADKLILKYKSNKATSIHTRLINAAHHNKIPVLSISNSILQFGNGSKSKWLQSTFTENTSALSANLSKDKFQCAAALRAVGLPVPDHYKISNMQQACDAANMLGYPLVIKPTNMDQGMGVIAEIETELELKAAFEKVSSLSREFLIERHIYGKDYRLVVFNNELIWAVERVPAGVMGDGISTITELVNIVNSGVRGKTGYLSMLKALNLDDEAKTLISKKGYSPESIPKENEFIAFRTISNISVGGFPIAVYDKVHPDNAKLAIAAADSLRLDLAGIDLLIPDIGVSWKNSIAGICEVNAQPDLGTITGNHLYGEILKKYLKNNYSIPIIVVLGDKDPSVTVNDIAQVFIKSKLRISTFDGKVLKINNVIQELSKLNFWTSSQSILRNREVDLAILSINDDSFIDLGFPFEYFDFAIIAGDNILSKNHQRSYELILDVFMQSAVEMVKTKIFAIKENLESVSKIHKDLEKHISIESFRKIKTMIKQKLITASDHHSVLK